MNELKQYIRDHARDVADLATLHTIETTTDPRYRRILEKQLEAKYEDEWQTAKMNEAFGDW
jgi:hypothetical protein